MSILNLAAAGEYLVIANLLKHGYVAMKNPVDSGIDIIASKTEDFDDLYRFQVKTTSRNSYSVRMSNKKFDQLWKERINLCCVLWADLIPRIVVFPVRLIYMMSSGGFKDSEAPFRKGRKSLNLRFGLSSDGDIFVRNNSNLFNEMENRFDLADPVDSVYQDIPLYAGWSDNPKQLIQFFGDEL